MATLYVAAFRAAFFDAFSPFMADPGLTSFHSGTVVNCATSKRNEMQYSGP